MARNIDLDTLRALGFSGDPTPGEAAEAREAVRLLGELSALVTTSADSLSTLMDDGEAFAGKTADTLREKVTGELASFLRNLAGAAHSAHEALDAFVTVMEREQPRVDAALAAAAGMDTTNPAAAAHIATLNDAKANYDSAAATASARVREASAMRTMPLSSAALFWKAFHWLTLIINIFAVIFGGPLGLLAFGMNIASLIKTAVDFSQGKVGGLELFLAALGILFPTTKGILPLLKSGALSGLKGLKNVMANGWRNVGDIFGTIGLGLRGLGLSGMKLALVATGIVLSSVVLRGGLWAVKLLPTVAMSTIRGLRWTGGQLVDFGKYLYQGSKGWGMLAVVLPVATDELAFGLRTALRIGVWERGILMRPTDYLKTVLAGTTHLGGQAGSKIPGLADGKLLTPSHPAFDTLFQPGGGPGSLHPLAMNGHGGDLARVGSSFDTTILVPSAGGMYVPVHGMAAYSFDGAPLSHNFAVSPTGAHMISPGSAHAMQSLDGLLREMAGDTKPFGSVFQNAGSLPGVGGLQNTLLDGQAFAKSAIGSAEEIRLTTVGEIKRLGAGDVTDLRVGHDRIVATFDGKTLPGHTPASSLGTGIPSTAPVASPSVPPALLQDAGDLAGGVRGTGTKTASPAGAGTNAGAPHADEALNLVTKTVKNVNAPQPHSSASPTPVAGQPGAAIPTPVPGAADSALGLVGKRPATAVPHPSSTGVGGTDAAASARVTAPDLAGASGTTTRPDLAGAPKPAGSGSGAPPPPPGERVYVRAPQTPNGPPPAAPHTGRVVNDPPSYGHQGGGNGADADALKATLGPEGVHELRQWAKGLLDPKDGRTAFDAKTPVDAKNPLDAKNPVDGKGATGAKRGLDDILDDLLHGDTPPPYSPKPERLQGEPPGYTLEDIFGPGFSRGEYRTDPISLHPVEIHPLSPDHSLLTDATGSARFVLDGPGGRLYAADGTELTGHTVRVDEASGTVTVTHTASGGTLVFDGATGELRSGHIPLRGGFEDFGARRLEFDHATNTHRLLDADGRPLAGVEVRFDRATGDFTVTDPATGRFTVYDNGGHLLRDGVPVRAADGTGTGERIVREHTGTDANRWRVLDAEGRPLADRIVTETEDGTLRVATADGGRIDVHDRADGALRLRKVRMEGDGLAGHSLVHEPGTGNRWIENAGGNRAEGFALGTRRTPDGADTITVQARESPAMHLFDGNGRHLGTTRPTTYSGTGSSRPEWLTTLDDGTRYLENAAGTRRFGQGNPGAGVDEVVFPVRGGTGTATYNATDGTLLTEEFTLPGRGGKPGEHFRVDHRDGTWTRIDGEGRPAHDPSANRYDLYGDGKLVRSGPHRYELRGGPNGDIPMVRFEDLGRGREVIAFRDPGGVWRLHETSIAGPAPRPAGHRTYTPDGKGYTDSTGGLFGHDIRYAREFPDGSWLRAEYDAAGRNLEWTLFNKDGARIGHGPREKSWFGGFKDRIAGAEGTIVHRQYSKFHPNLDRAGHLRKYDLTAENTYAPGRTFKEYSIQGKETHAVTALNDDGTHLLTVTRRVEQRIPGVFWEGAAKRPLTFWGDDGLMQTFRWTETRNGRVYDEGIRAVAPDGGHIDFSTMRGGWARQEIKLADGEVLKFTPDDGNGTWTHQPPTPPGGGEPPARTGTRLPGEDGALHRFVDSEGHTVVEVFPDGRVIEHIGTGRLRIERNPLGQISLRCDDFGGTFIEGRGNPRRRAWTWEAENGGLHPRLSFRGRLDGTAWDDSFIDFRKTADGKYAFERMSRDLDAGRRVVSHRNAAGGWETTIVDVKGVAEATTYTRQWRTGEGGWQGDAPSLSDWKQGHRVEFRDLDDQGRTVFETVQGRVRHHHDTADPKLWREYDHGKLFRESKAYTQTRVNGDVRTTKYLEYDAWYQQWRVYDEATGKLEALATTTGRSWVRNGAAFESAGNGSALGDFFRKWDQWPGFPDGSWRSAVNEIDYQGASHTFRSHARRIGDPHRREFADYTGGAPEFVGRPVKIGQKFLYTTSINFVLDFGIGMAVTAIANDGHVSTEDVLKNLVRAGVSGVLGGSTQILQDTVLRFPRQGLINHDAGALWNRTPPGIDSVRSEWGAMEQVVRWRVDTFDWTMALLTGQLGGLISGSLNAYLFDGLEGMDAFMKGLYSMASAAAGSAFSAFYKMGLLGFMNGRYYHRGGFVDFALGTVLDKILGKTLGTALGAMPAFQPPAVAPPAVLPPGTPPPVPQSPPAGGDENGDGRG